MHIYHELCGYYSFNKVVINWVLYFKDNATITYNLHLTEKLAGIDFRHKLTYKYTYNYVQNTHIAVIICTVFY